MKKNKIFSLKEFYETGRQLAPKMLLFDVCDENIAISPNTPLFESECTAETTKIENAIIALPANLDETVVNVDSLSDTITRFVDNLNVEGDLGFSVGHFFAGDYTSDESVWDRNSLCVSLYGTISDRKTTIATAIEIANAHKLPKILVIGETSIVELAAASAIITPSSKNRIKRLYEYEDYIKTLN